MKLKKVLSIILSSAMIVSVVPVESFAADLDVAVEEFSDEMEESVTVEDEDETINDEESEVEIQDDDEEEQQDVYSDMGEEITDEFSDGENNIELFSDNNG
ncbi:hypothetical protein, partial [Blautia obeum]|uniref:hypothetical protein n=1 Tax=Blautia obeum TaxID=40520 RepID=UPI001A9B6BCB